MRTGSCLAVLLAVAGTLAAAQDKPAKSVPEQFLIKIDVIEHGDSLVLPKASLKRGHISIYRGEEKAGLLKQRKSKNWGKSVSAPMVRTLTGFPAVISTTGTSFIRSVVFVDGQSLLLSLGFLSEQIDFKDMKASDFELHTTYFNEGDILLVRRGKSKFVLVEITQIKADD